jgi:hypothetical protein
MVGESVRPDIMLAGRRKVQDVRTYPDAFRACWGGHAALFGVRSVGTRELSKLLDDGLARTTGRTGGRLTQQRI